MLTRLRMSSADGFTASVTMVAPALIVFAVVLGIPLIGLLVSSGWQSGQPTAAHFFRLAGDAHNLGIIFTTLKYGVIVTVICAAIGFPYAYVAARAPAPLARILLLAVFLPMTSSVIVKSFGWSIIMKSNGMMNSSLIALGLIDAPVRFIFTPTALYLGSVSMLLPFMILPIYSVLKSIPDALIDAASTLGAGWLFRMTRVVLPLGLHGMVSGASFVFSMTVAAYVIPSLLAGGQFQVLSKTVANAFLVTDQPGFGSAASVVLLALGMGGAMSLNRLAHRLRPQS